MLKLSQVTRKQPFPAVGAVMGFSFFADNGFEGYSYSWGGHPDLDSSKPLELLNHLGGNPIIGIVGRGKVSLNRIRYRDKNGPR